MGRNSVSSSAPLLLSSGNTLKYLLKTPVLSKIFERLLAKNPKVFVHIHILPATHFAFKKMLGTCDKLLIFTSEVQVALVYESETRAVTLDFSSAFNSVNHRKLIYKLKSIDLLVSEGCF